MTKAERLLGTAYLYVNAAFWREDQLGKASCPAYDIAYAMERAIPNIAKLARKVELEELDG